MNKLFSTLEKLTFQATMWATVNMWWRICPLFTLLIIHHPVWHYPPLLVCGPSHTSIMSHDSDLLWAAVTNQPPSRKCSIIHAQIGRILRHATVLKATSKNSSSYCYCTIMKQMMMACVFVSSFHSRLQVNPSESPQLHTLPTFLSCLCQGVYASVCLWKCHLLFLQHGLL